jgi:hypothetical protein
MLPKIPEERLKKLKLLKVEQSLVATEYERNTLASEFLENKLSSAEEKYLEKLTVLLEREYAKLRKAMSKKASTPDTADTFEDFIHRVSDSSV